MKTFTLKTKVKLLSTNLLFKMTSILIFLVLLIYQFSCEHNRDEKQLIRFWAMGAEGEMVKKLKPEFEKQNPNIRLKIQMIPWTAAQEKLISAYAGKNLPDLFQLGNTWIPQFVALHAIENLNSWIDSSSKINKEQYFKGIWETNVLDSTVYGIPWYIDTRVLFYRTDILKKAGFDHPPRTWGELYHLSKNIKKLYGKEGKYAIYLPTNEWAPFIIFGMQAGAALLKENDSYGNFSSPEFTRAFKYLIRFYHERLTPIGFTEVTNIYQAFAQGYFAMYISGPWNVREFKKWMKDTLQDKWMTSPLPALDNDHPGYSMAGGSSLVLNKESKQKKAAWKFIEFLSSPKIQIKFYLLVNDLPAVKKAWEDSLLKNDPYMRAFYRQFHYVKALPKIPEWEQIAYAKFQQYAEYAARNKMSPAEALKALDRDVDKILEKRRWLLNQKLKKARNKKQ